MWRLLLPSALWGAALLAAIYGKGALALTLFLFGVSALKPALVKYFSG
ncbi:MAG: hypothetical protein N3E40_02025 [Dehalococcoidia bacterium]|nr:hypothetical protein [Dehalococcoidia bacterium]